MNNEINEKFLQLNINDTRCPDKIKEMGIKEESIYLLRNRTECGDWELIGHLFFKVTGSYIMTKPIAGRQYFTLEPKAVVDIMKANGIW